MAHQCLEHGKFAGGQGQVFVGLAQRARAQVKDKRTKTHDLVVA